MLINIMIYCAISAAVAAVTAYFYSYLYYNRILSQLRTDLVTARAHEQSLEREIHNAEEFAEAMGTQFKAWPQMHLTQLLTGWQWSRKKSWMHREA